MEPSQAPHERPAKDADSAPVEPGSIERFKALSARLFAVSRKDFMEALEKDERDRRAKRGR